MDVKDDSPAAAAIDVTIKFRGRSIQLSPSPDATIADLKSLLEPLTNVLHRGQKLIHKGRILLDPMTFRSAEIPVGAKIMLLASDGLHQGSGPITKELLISPNLKKSDTISKSERTADFIKHRAKPWKATGIIALSGCNLKAIPDEVWSCGASARVLDISNNFVQEIPTQVSSLSSLQKLFVNYNDLSDDSISWEGLSCFKFLSFMSLSGNRLTTIPSALGALVSLRCLHIGDNNLVVLPIEIGFLIKLEVLKVNNNRLRIIPETIGDCVALIEVDFSSNFLKELPHTVENLKNLKVLHLNHNALNSLPPSLFTKCDQLSTLDLHCTRITSDFLRKCNGWNEFDERRRSKHQKQLDFRILGSDDFDEDADKR